MNALDADGLMVLGALLLIAYAAHELGAYAHVPRVTLLMLLGVCAGPFGLNIVVVNFGEWFPAITHIALAMVGFLLGERFYGKDLKKTGNVILSISIAETLLSAAMVYVVLLIIGMDAMLALILAGIAPASAPASTVDVIREAKASGPLANTVLGVLAIDDAWGIILFSIFLVIAESTLPGNHNASLLWAGVWEIVGAIALGCALGFPMAWLTGRLKKGEPALMEAVGFVLLCGGMAAALEVSYLLACMVLGATVANRAKHHTRPFREIEGASEPFMALFFFLAGYKLELSALNSIGMASGAYIIARSVGLVIGGRLGATAASAPALISRYIGWCLLPQAGLALGMALLVNDRLPELGQWVLPLIISTTVVFEIVAPVVTRLSLWRAGEIPST